VASASVISIVDYGVCNLGSIRNMLRKLGFQSELVTTPQALAGASKIILPGIGAFDHGISALRERGLAEPLRLKALEERVPLLGICLGMQLLASRSLEFGEYEGLGLVPGTVERIEPGDGLRVPHMGWNSLELRRESALFEGFPDEPTCYFVHSYHLVPDDPEVVTATTPYGGPVTACVETGNVFGAQFHPEKSQRDGLALLRNFLAAPC
jgi:glutamine amidotransferase